VFGVVFVDMQFEVNSQCSFFDLVVNGRKRRHEMQVAELETGSRLHEATLL